MTGQDRYSLTISGPAARALATKLPEKVAAAAYEFISGPLLDNPHRVGKPLRDKLDGMHSARRGDYRIIYVIGKTHVEVIRIDHRSGVYR